MIAYLEGRLLKKYDEKIILVVNGTGYEIFLPVSTFSSISEKFPGDSLSFFIYHHQGEHQPKPVLIGFINEMDREFFQYFISVDAIGPLKAVKAISAPVGEIARAIENSDVKFLARLKGIGPRTAQKVVASLQGRVGKFALMKELCEPEKPDSRADIENQVFDVLVTQLGYKLQDAKRMISEAGLRKPGFSTPEELFEEVYRGEKHK